jgi:hypothetical protein
VEKSGCIIKVSLCVLCVGNRGHRPIYVGKCGLSVEPVLTLGRMYVKLICDTTGSNPSSQLLQLLMSSKEISYLPLELLVYR